MAPIGVKARRAVAAVPFLFIAAWCFRNMDIDKLVVMQQPYADSGVIEWDGGRIPIIDHFHNVDFFDQVWRGTMATFSPSTFGYDSVAWWQMFSFLIDLGPVYAIWILESRRAGSAYTPAFLPTLFTFAGQLLGLGSVAPVFYFLSFAFGPTASDLARTSARGRKIGHQESGLLLLIVLAFHTCEVFAMFLAPNLATRHYWTWAWQLAPVWIGISNFLLSRVASPLLPKSGVLTSPKTVLAVLGLVSAGVWIYTLSFSPFSLSTIFIPLAEAQSEYVPHVRKALQTDHLAVFSSSFLWLTYSFLDLSSAGLLSTNWVLNVALVSIVAAIAGPGAAFIFGWYIRERALSSVEN
ncbi:hypothetical protein F4820DRAFT_462258 [Hypoxylon rubiginosum]|uniref:Uncharacterized protein n=1 Tax=Hypoxylon rubiginosum TaxID=110542 RepID=A0ACB9YK60_9PEZI|nr:hypothetical protein F4820DRAFT_462258 [Hypoxylon rubiginosum]